MAYTKPSKTDHTMLKALENGYLLAGQFRISDRQEVLIEQARMTRKAVDKLEDVLNFDISNVMHELKEYFPDIPENTLDFLDGFEVNNYQENGAVNAWLVKTREYMHYQRMWIDKHNPKNKTEEQILESYMENNGLSIEDLDDEILAYRTNEKGNVKPAEPNIIHRAYERFTNYLVHDNDLGFTDRTGNHVLGNNAKFLEMYLEDSIKYNDAADHNLNMLGKLKNKEEIDDSYVFMIRVNDGAPTAMPLEQLGATQLKYFNSLPEDKREEEKRKLQDLLNEISRESSKGMFA